MLFCRYPPKRPKDRGTNATQSPCPSHRAATCFQSHQRSAAWFVLRLEAHGECDVKEQPSAWRNCGLPSLCEENHSELPASDKTELSTRYIRSYSQPTSCQKRDISPSRGLSRHYFTLQPRSCNIVTIFSTTILVFGTLLVIVPIQLPRSSFRRSEVSSFI